VEFEYVLHGAGEDLDLASFRRMIALPVEARPILSVCIPTFNRAERLSPLVEAVISQILQARLEEVVDIVISDNHSPDHTFALCQTWMRKHGFVKCFRNEWNIGGDPNHLMVIERSTGKFAWVLGDDDHIHDTTISTILSALTGEVSQLFLNYKVVDTERRCLVPARLSPDLPDDPTTAELIKRVGYVSVFALITTHVFCRDTFLQAGRMFLLRMSPWYVLNAGLLIGFHDKPVRILREPVFDYTVGNERLPPESATYARVIMLIRTLNWLQEAGKIDADFVHDCVETGARATIAAHLFEEEMLGSIGAMTNYWAMPGAADRTLLFEFIKNARAAPQLRENLLAYFCENDEDYWKITKPIIYRWNGGPWIKEFSILLVTDSRADCQTFDKLAANWPAKFPCTSILMTTVPETEADARNVDIHMAPAWTARVPCEELNAAFRITMSHRLFVVFNLRAADGMPIAKRLEELQAQDGPQATLIFEKISQFRIRPVSLVGLFLNRKALVEIGGFENIFPEWSLAQLLVDAALRLGAKGCTIEGQPIPAALMKLWLALQCWKLGLLRLWILRAAMKRGFPRRLSAQAFREHALNWVARMQSF
jgi:glycosyltransferase involved in cell wall biosynthesis